MLLSGDGPFYHYNWVFYADLIAGALTGVVAARLRSRGTPGGLSVAWYVAGLVFGTVVGAAVFLPAFMLSALMSVGFSETPPALMFALTVVVIVLAVGSVMVRKRRA